MDLKRGKVIISAVAAISLGSFAMPFGSIAGASTGPSTRIVRSNHDAGGFVQLAQEEHEEVEEKSEHKVTESNESTVPPDTTVVAPDTTTVAPGTTVVVPENTVVRPDTEQHSENKSVDKEKSVNVLGLHAKVEHHVDESDSN